MLFGSCMHASCCISQPILKKTFIGSSRSGGAYSAEKSNNKKTQSKNCSERNARENSGEHQLLLLLLLFFVIKPLFCTDSVAGGKHLLKNATNSSTSDVF